MSIRTLFLSLLVLPQLLACEAHDPFLWLEDDQQPRTISWLADQQQRTESYFDKESTLRLKLRGRLTDLLSWDLMGVPSDRSGRLLYVGKKSGQLQPCLYQIMEDGSHQIIIDPTALYPDGTVSFGGYNIHRGTSLLTYGLCHAGSDQQEWRVRNLITGEELGDVFPSLFLFHHPVFDRKGEGLFYGKFRKEGGQQIWYHRLGRAESEDLCIFTEEQPDIYLFDLTCTKEGDLLFHAGRGCDELTTIFRYHEGRSTQLFPLGEVHYDYVGEREGRLFFITTHHAPHGKIISIDPDHPKPCCWREHLPEGRSFIEHATLVGDHLAVSFMRDAHGELKVFDLEGQLRHEIALPGIGTAAQTLRGWRLSASRDGSFFFYSYSDYARPLSIYRFDLASGSSSPFHIPTISWNPDEYVTKQIFYPSKDGALVPLFLFHRKDLSPDQPHPTLLYGYGGFGITISPQFDPERLAFVEAGGIYAAPGIRGGGEYGEEWHLAGALQHKQTSFDDFIAAAEWLCRQGYTSRSKLAIQGRSNGGLLVAASMTQRPDLFRAVISDVAVLDMLRFHLFTVGWGWVTEYGSPDDPAARETLLSYSPYHQVQNGLCYPATLITTGDHDNRVVPLHSYKFAAALQAVGAPTTLRVYPDAGHGWGKSTLQRLDEATDHLSFLFHELQMNQ